MQTNSTLTSSEQVLSSLSDKVRARYSEAEDYCRHAVTLHDFGIGRGLLLALLKDERITQVEFNALFNRMIGLVPKGVIESIPLEHRANYGRGIVVPAAPSTRNARERERADPLA